MKYIVAALAFGTTMLACGTDFGNSTGTVRVNKHGVDVNIDVPFDDAGDTVKWPDQDCLWTPTLVCCESGCVGIGDDSSDAADNSDRDSGSDNSDGSLGPSQDGEVDGSDASDISTDNDSGGVSDTADSGNCRDAGKEEEDAGVKCTVPVRVFKNHGDCVSFCSHSYLKGSLREHGLFVECKNDCDCAYDN